MAEFNLQRIILPVSAHDFASRYLGVAPLLVLRQSSDYFADLFSMADLAALIDGERLRPPEIRMTKDGVGFRTESIANTLRAGRYVLSAAVVAVGFRYTVQLFVPERCSTNTSCPSAWAVKPRPPAGVK